MPTNDINLTTSQGVSPSLVEYYERKLLENALPRLVHGRDAQKRTLPPNSGRTIKFRKFTPFAAATAPLAEGVTPDGQDLDITEIEATIQPHGQFVRLSDETQYITLDNMHKESAELLANQAALSLDTLDRDALMQGTNVQWANGKTSRSALKSSDKLTSLEIRKAVRSLENNNAPRFPDGDYHAILSPSSEFDLQDDAAWIDVAKYQNREQIQSGEIGRLFGVRFFKSTNPAKLETPEEILEDVETLTVGATTPWAAATKTLTLAGKLTTAQATAMAGKMRNLNGTTVVVASAGAHETAATLVLKADPGDAVTGTWGGKTVYPYGGGLDGAPLTATLVYGKNAFGNVELGGTGKNVRIIIRTPESGGSDDPLAQRGSGAWKVKGYTMKILQDVFLKRIEHGYSL